MKCCRIQTPSTGCVADVVTVLPMMRVCACVCSWSEIAGLVGPVAVAMTTRDSCPGERWWDGARYRSFFSFLKNLFTLHEVDVPVMHVTVVAVSVCVIPLSVCPPCRSSWSIPPLVTSQCVTSPEARADQHSEQHSSFPPNTHTIGNIWYIYIYIYIHIYKHTNTRTHTHIHTHTHWRRLSVLTAHLFPCMTMLLLN